MTPSVIDSTNDPLPAFLRKAKHVLKKPRAGRLGAPHLVLNHKGGRMRQPAHDAPCDCEVKAAPSLEAASAVVAMVVVAPREHGRSAVEVAKEVWPCSFSEAGGASSSAAQAKATSEASVRQSPRRMRAELLHSRARVLRARALDLATGPEGVAIIWVVARGAEK